MQATWDLQATCLWLIARRIATWCLCAHSRLHDAVWSRLFLIWRQDAECWATLTSDLHAATLRVDVETCRLHSARVWLPERKKGALGSNALCVMHHWVSLSSLSDCSSSLAATHVAMRLCSESGAAAVPDTQAWVPSSVHEPSWYCSLSSHRIRS